MAFWNKSPDAHTPAALNEALDNTQHALMQARRRLLGAMVLLTLACALIPWMLDSSPRPWADDVILRMPKSEQPFQAKPNTSAPATAATPAAKPASEIKPLDTKPVELKP
jgi:DedD protein